MGRFDVRVVNNKGEGKKGVRVVLGFNSILRGMTSDVYTDSDGHARFNGYDDGEVTAYLNGSDYGTFYYRNGGSITITM